jgi:hypothetical protein
LKNKVSSLKIELKSSRNRKKDFNNAMGRKFNPFDQPKRKKTNKKPKSTVENRPTVENKLSQTTKASKYHPISYNENLQTTRKLIIITKMS